MQARMWTVKTPVLVYNNLSSAQAGVIWTHQSRHLYQSVVQESFDRFDTTLNSLKRGILIYLPQECSMLQTAAVESRVHALQADCLLELKK